MTTPIDIRADHLRIVHDVLARHLPDGVKVWVFGSRATWATNDSSDLDLALEGDGQIPARSLTVLESAFEDSDLPYAVDVVDVKRISERFRGIVERQSVPLPVAREAQDGGRWKDVPLGDLVDIYDGPHATPSKTRSGPVFLGISNLASGRLDLTQAEHLSEADYRRWTRRVTPAPNDIVFSYETRLGEAALIPRGLRACLGRRMGLLRPRDGAIDARFLLYAFLGEKFQDTLRERTVHGSTVDRILLTEMADFPIRAPRAVAEQRAIAHILGTLDDKIELNRRINATLEAMARALFRSWFVDFDPVRTKLEGRDTGLPKDIADLFPDRLVNSELGETPLGWPVESLADHFEAVRGVSYKGSGLTGDGTALHNLNSIHEGGGYKYEGIKFYSGKYAERHRVRPGDVIVANTEQGHERLLIGYAALVPGLVAADGIASHHIYRLRTRPAGWFSTRFLVFLLNSARMHDLVSGYANGTTVNMLPIDAVQRPLFVVPPRTLVEAFDVVVSRSEQRREQAVRESRTLTVVREALLPKLVSGEVRVRDAERLVGAIA